MNKTHYLTIEFLISLKDDINILPDYFHYRIMNRMQSYIDIDLINDFILQYYDIYLNIQTKKYKNRLNYFILDIIYLKLCSKIDLLLIQKAYNITNILSIYDDDKIFKNLIFSNKLKINLKNSDMFEYSDFEVYVKKFKIIKFKVLIEKLQFKKLVKNFIERMYFIKLRRLNINTYYLLNDNIEKNIMKFLY
jgi:hypothetical protein